MRVFAQCNQWQCSSQQTVTKKSRGLISAVIIKENKSEEKAIYFDEKITTYQGNSILVLSLLKSQIMHAEEFVLIPKRMFMSKNQTKEEIFDNPLYQQKATQLSLLLDLIQILSRAVEKKMLTQALIDVSQEQGVSVMEQVIEMTQNQNYLLVMTVKSNP